MVEDGILLALSGPSKAERLSSLEKLTNVIPPEILKVLIDIEQVQLTLADYKNKERYLEDISRLSHGQAEATQIIIFHHLLGTLYINFEKFWGPTLRVIIELLNVSKYKEKLLAQLLQELKRSNDYIYGKIAQDLPQDRPDYVLHRNFILQILAKFSDFVAANNVLFMDQMFLFIKQELMVSPFIEKLARQNLRSKHESGRKRPTSSASKSKETFITMTRIVQTFRNMSSVHRHEEFREFILDLLSSRDASMQKAAFNCLTAYDIPYLKLYVDKILKLLDDKKIRSELSAFSIDSESGQINDEHRNEVIPIIHRILFGRMIGQVGRKTSGRDHADKRKSTVMRYVTGCTTEEVIGFFGLLFDPLFKFANVPYENIEATLRDSFSLENYVPLNKMQAMLSTLDSYMESVANLKPETLPHLLKMINIIAYCVVTPLEDESLLNQIDTHSIKTLKILRRECLEITTEYFSSFAFYKFSQIEMDFVFKTIIWPSSKGFVDRNHATVTPVLKLINALMENEVYHKLIVKRNKLNKNEYLLQHLMDLYADHKIERQVSKYVAQMIFNLLKLKTEDSEPMELDEGEQEIYLLDDQDAVITPNDASLYKVSGGESLGFQMIMQYLPVIFDRLKRNCELYLEKKDRSYRLETNELHILSALSVYLKDSSHCALAAEFLLCTLENQKDGDLIISTLKTSQALMKQVGELKDLKIVEYIANTLSYQRNVEQRKELCNLVEILARIDSNLEPASRAIKLMNTTNEDLVDNPDLAAWNEGFSIAFKYLDELDSVAMNSPEEIQGSMTLLLHQTGYIVNTVDKYEFSVRENCLIFYEKLAARINLIDSDRNNRLLKQLVTEIILEKLIKKGLKETNDSIRHTHLGIIRILASGCHEKNNTLGEFHMFCNTNLDLDFWHNIKDIKLHNRSKALARLVADEEKLMKVSSKTLTSYFMPIASGFLFNKNYKSLASLIDNSIKLIGIICRQQVWSTYESTLNHYLDLLMKANTTYQRTNIKLITEILKNFNFSLETCEEAMQHEEENKKLEVRMKRRCGQAMQQEKLDAAEWKPKRLPPSTARLIYTSVTKRIIPKLNSCLHEMARVDFEYDKNMVDYVPEKDDIKRIPMAFAIVQLLSLLPGKYVLLRDQLPALFLKLTTFLKSKNEDTRKAARSTLLRIMSFLGPAYLPDMLRVLRQNLDKGFYVHVLNYTVHSVLSKLSLQYGDLDSSTHDLMNLCKEEIFGKPSEDKEIAQVLAKTSEAKKTKSYDTLLILAHHITGERLDLIMNPIKDMLRTANEPKTVNKLATCLQRVFTGLSQNEEFPLDDLIMFIQNSIQDSLPNLKVRQMVDQAETPASQVSRREDRFLITKDKTKNRVKSKINEKGNLHMVVENSLRLLLLIFEKNKTAIKQRESLQLKLDGLIGLLTACLKSSSPRCVMRSLKCLHFIAQTKIDLPSFKTTSNSIVKMIFILLSLYNGVGMVQGDNYEMIAMCFKTLTLLLLTCEHVQLNGKQIRALMSYIEQDIHDASRQATAFRALNSLLQKKCNSPELVDIMAKVADLLVTSSDESVRSLSTRCWQTYLLEYEHEASTLQAHLTKFLRQIDYEFIDGRRSVLKMLRVIVEKFPERILRNYMELFFHLLAQRVVNDDSKEIREVVGRLIALLMQRLPDRQSFVLNKFIFPWASGTNPELKMLGVKLISIFVESNPLMFAKSTQDVVRVLTIVNAALQESASKCEKTSKVNGGKKEDADDLKLAAAAAAAETEMDDNENTSPDAEQTNGTRAQQPPPLASQRRVTVQDRLVYHSLRLFKRLLSKELISCAETRYISQLKTIWQDIATSKLTHWHEPVVLTSCELYMTFITKTTLNQSLQVNEPRKDNYLDWNATRIVRVLCDKYLELSDRFDPATSKVFAYAMQSLIMLGQMVAASPATLEFEQKYLGKFGDNDVLAHMFSLEELPNDGFVKEHLPYQITEAKKRCDLMWLSIKCVMQARKEAALFRLSQSHRRDLVLRWTAAVAQELGASRIGPYVVLFLMTPVRELTDKAKNKSVAVAGGDELRAASLVPMSQDLMKFIKGLIGVEQFNKIYSKVQLHYTRKRVERKAELAKSKVVDQARGSKRKMAENKKKQVNKKRKIIAKRKAALMV